MSATARMIRGSEFISATKTLFAGWAPMKSLLVCAPRRKEGFGRLIAEGLGATKLYDIVVSKLPRPKPN